MNWRLKRTVNPPESPVTVTELKSQSRIDTSAEDTLVQRIIDSATAAIEGPYGIGVLLVEQTWELSLDRFPTEIHIPLYPLISVTSIEYVDEDGTTQTLASSVYRVDTWSNPPRISLEWNQSWPSTRLLNNAVTVTFTGGYEAVSGADYQGNIPEDLRHAVLMLSAHYYEHRDAVLVGTSVTTMPLGVQTILDRYRVAGFG